MRGLLTSLYQKGFSFYYIFIMELTLILRFYKSQQINWVSLEEALEMAPVQHKPIHAISIDGPLADESC